MSPTVEIIAPAPREIPGRTRETSTTGVPGR